MKTTAAPAPETSEALIETYRDSVPGAAGAYDELLDGRGGVRRHWGELVEGLSGLTAAERAARADGIERRVRDTGIAYDIFSDPSMPSQRWQLDLAPLLISSEEWRQLEAGLVQRAQLFDALLNDLYGKQDLLRRGLVPPELVFSDESFLRPCQDILPRAGRLRFYAADLARDPDGHWRVIDNHTETLAGIGYALANRVVHTHVAGDLFKRCNAIRLSSYFHALQASLTTHTGRDNARIALLTPGPHHPDYFSHAYLARYLGYLLVEGSDLRTKGNSVFLKTLEGLKEIDLIVRCADGRESDPLELDPAGFDGPAGLLRVCRAMPRLVVNAVGTAVVQNRGLGPYLSRIAEDLIGEPLALEDAPRWWLGDPAQRAEAMERLEHLVIRRAQEGTGRPGQAALGRDAGASSHRELDALKRDIGLRGARLVAEERTGFSVAPSFSGGALSSRPFAVRFFLTWTEDGYKAMPGGLAMTVDPNRAVALSAPDAHTHDVWVLSESEQSPHVSLWRPKIETARVDRSQRVIQSRVADDLFWLGRYSERADWTMRVLRSAQRRIAEDSGPPTDLGAVRKCLETLLVKRPELLPERHTPAGDLEISRLCERVIAGKKIPRTLERTLEGLYKVAHLTRDRLSLEAWQTLSRFRPGDTWIRSLSSAGSGALLDRLEEGLSSVSAFNGLMHENMTRNFGWSFLDMGRRLERAYNLSEAILALFPPLARPDEESSSLLLLLELADSFITYRSRYRIDPSLALVLDLLLLDESNPRALAYQLASISTHLEALPNTRRGVGLAEDRRLILTLLTSVRLADVTAMAEESDRTRLAQLMQEQISLLPELSDAVSRHYFNLLDDAPQRVHMRSEPKS